MFGQEVPKVASSCCYWRHCLRRLHQQTECDRWESNPQSRRHKVLDLTCMPIPPLSHCFFVKTPVFLSFFLFCNMTARVTCPLFHPYRLAIIGAGNKPSIGYAVFTTLFDTSCTHVSLLSSAALRSRTESSCSSDKRDYPLHLSGNFSMPACTFLWQLLQSTTHLAISFSILFTEQLPLVAASETLKSLFFSVWWNSRHAEQFSSQIAHCKLSL